MKQEKKQERGSVVEALPSAFFRIELEDGKKALCHLAGKLRRYHIKILPGDRVLVELSPYDQTRGRIVYRLK